MTIVQPSLDFVDVQLTASDFKTAILKEIQALEAQKARLTLWRSQLIKDRSTTILIYFEEKSVTHQLFVLHTILNHGNVAKPVEKMEPVTYKRPISQPKTKLEDLKSRCDRARRNAKQAQLNFGLGSFQYVKAASMVEQYENEIIEATYPENVTGRC